MMGDTTGADDRSTGRGSPALENALSLVGAGASVSALSTVLTAVSAFLTTALIVRLLGVRSYGALAFSLSIVAMGASLARAGVGTATQRTIATESDAGNVESTAPLVRGLSSVTVLGGCVGLVVVTCVVGVTQTQLPVEARLALGACLGVLLLGRNVAFAVSAIGGGLGRPWALTLPPFFGILGQLLVALTLTALGVASVVAVAAGYALVGVAMALTAIAIVRVLLPRYSGMFRVKLRPALDLMRLARPFAIAGVSALLIASFDVFVLGIVHPGAPVGSYAPVLALTETLILLPPRLLQSLFVTAAAGLSSKRTPDFEDLYVRVSKLAVVLAMPAVILLLIAPNELLSLAFGGVFPRSDQIVWILVAGYVVHIACGFNAQALVAWGDRRSLVTSFLWPLAAMLLFSITLIPALGGVGAALATALSYVVMNLSLSATLFRQTGVHPMKRGLLILLALSPVAVASAALMFSQLPKGVPGAIGAAFVAWVCWCGAGWALGAFRLSELAAFDPRKAIRRR